MSSFYGNYGTSSGGGSGTTDYNELTNKPKIDGEELVGDLSLEDKYALKGECGDPIWEDFSKNLEEEIVKERLILFYNFSRLDTTGNKITIEDLSGHENDGVLYGEGYDLKNLALELPGGDAGSNAAYVELPRGFFDNKELLTMTMWVRDDLGAGNYSAFYIGNEQNAQYFLLNPINPFGKIKAVIADNNDPVIGWPFTTEVGCGNSNTPEDGPDGNDNWNFYAFTLTANELGVYINGDKYASYPLTYGGVPAFGQNLVSYIGKSLYPDPLFKGGIKDFRIYEKILTNEKIKDIYTIGTYGTYVPIDYNDLANKPSIDGIELQGDISLKDKYVSKDEIDSLGGSLIVSYNFGKVDFDNGTAIVRDGSGNNNDAYIRGSRYSIYDNTIELPGGLADSDAAYIELPRGLFNGKENLTFSLKAKNFTNSGNYSLFFVGSEGNPPTNYIMLNPKDVDGRLKACITNDVNVNAPWETETGPGTLAFPFESPLMDNDWHVYTLTVTPSLFSVYLDGKLWNRYPLNRSVINFEDELVSYLGRSSYPDEFFHGRIQDFRAYDKTLTDTEVNDIYTSDLVDQHKYQFRYGLEPVADYTTSIFEDQLLDNTGHGFNATLVNLDQHDVKENGDHKYIDFTNSNGYIQLPNNLIKGEEFSISATFRTPSADHSAIWTFGTDIGVNYFGLHPGNEEGVLLEVVKDGSYNGTTYEKIDYSDYKTIIVTFHKDGVAYVFLNGTKIGTLDYGVSIQNIIVNSLELEPNFIGYIGKSCSSADDPTFNGFLERVTIYDYAIPSNLIIDEDKYALKKNTVIIGSFSQNRKSDTTIGIYSHAEGYFTESSGYASHAEGSNTKAGNSDSHAEGFSTESSGYASHAEGEWTIASGEASHAEGYGYNNKKITASGQGAHAEGYYTTAFGFASHAEGGNTTASGNYSHAEGYHTTASEKYSHAEGNYTKAEGDYSHAEGHYTTASGNCSHAEGDGTQASGNFSHAEGLDCHALSYYSHAEGNQTVAHGANQHVEGEFNIEDKSQEDLSQRGKYIHIAGNGADYSKRSNAYTLDWEGNGEFQGDVVAKGCGGQSPISLVDLASKVEDLTQKWAAAVNGDEVSY